MPLPEAFLYELKMRNDITEVVSSYVNLNKRGRNMVGLCPFHNEKTPSFNIYTESSSCYCFGCGAGGDVISFIMKIENLDYIDAVKFLAQRVGMDMPESNFDDSMSNLRKRIYEANRVAARFFYRNLYSEKGKNGLEYFKSRALRENTICHFGLGYADSDRFSLCNHLKNEGFKNSEIVAANLAFQSKSGNGIYDRFNDRVMFPIIDLRGNVIAFGGRIMTDQKPKYLNTSDTPVFKKSANLFSLNNAKNTGDRTLILCEGYMDVIAVNQAGFQNAVATLGTALTPEQAVLMKRYADEVVICYDSDEAGQKATARAIQLLRDSGLAVKVITIPSGKDPDEFIRNKGENAHFAFKNLLEAGGNDVEYRLNKIKNSHNLETSEGRVAYLNEAVKVIATLDNAVEQEIYASKLSGEVDVSKESVIQQLNKQNRRIRKDIQKKEFKKIHSQLNGRDDKVNADRFKKPRGTTAEELLISYLINNPDRITFITTRIDEDKFQSEFNRKLYIYVIDKISNSVDPLMLVSGDFTADEASKIYKIANSYSAQTMNDDTMQEYINTITDEFLKQKVADVENASMNDINQHLSRLRQQRK